MGNLKNDILDQSSGTVNNQEKDKKKYDPASTTTDSSKNISLKQVQLREGKFLRTARLQTYSNWPHTTPHREVMASSGWFSCNQGDRVICIYCNTIFYQWTKNDDPYEAHARLAPKCPFVLSLPMLSSSPTKDIPCITQNPEGIFEPRHKELSGIFLREKTFENPNWKQVLPSISDLAQAGFFYSGIDSTVTCFYCGGSLHHWSDKDNPKIEHSRWFPNCLYAKQFCGEDLHYRIQIHKKKIENIKHPIDKNTLMRFLNARLDLPHVRRLIGKYSLQIVRKCLVDQFRINRDDFESENDFEVACLIVQKQLAVYSSDPSKATIPSKGRTSMNVVKSSETKPDLCVVCLTKERELACMPCGHFSTCVPCGYALTSCPLCRTTVASFIRINF